MSPSLVSVPYHFDIIIPVFNRRHCITRAMGSVYRAASHCKKYGWTFRLIVVDDGSVDGSGAVAEDFGRSAPDTVFVIVINKINGGPSSARNAGLEIAFNSRPEGRDSYLVFLDSDDVIEEEFFEFSFGRLAPNRILNYSFSGLSLHGTMNGEDAALLTIKRMGGVVNRIFPLDGWAGIRFPEAMMRYEDFYVVIRVLFQTEIVEYDEHVMYRIIPEEPSITRAPEDARFICVFSNSLLWLSSLHCSKAIDHAMFNLCAKFFLSIYPKYVPSLDVEARDVMARLLSGVFRRTKMLHFNPSSVLMFVKKWLYIVLGPRIFHAVMRFNRKKRAQ